MARVVEEYAAVEERSTGVLLFTVEAATVTPVSLTLIGVAAFSVQRVYMVLAET